MAADLHLVADAYLWRKLPRNCFWGLGPTAFKPAALLSACQTRQPSHGFGIPRSALVGSVHRMPRAERTAILLDWRRRRSRPCGKAVHAGLWSSRTFAWRPVRSASFATSEWSRLTRLPIVLGSGRVVDWPARFRSHRLCELIAPLQELSAVAPSEMRSNFSFLN